MSRRHTRNGVLCKRRSSASQGCQAVEPPRRRRSGKRVWRSFQGSQTSGPPPLSLQHSQYALKEADAAFGGDDCDAG